MKNKTENGTVVIGSDTVTIEDILRVAKGEARVSVSSDKQFVQRIENSQKNLMSAIERDVPVYGVNTGFGKSCGKRMPGGFAVENGINLYRFHGCGTGDPLGLTETRSTIICRMISFAKGYSGVSMELLEGMASLLNEWVTPVVPSEGSVGASGDLTPMSYFAALLAGEREAYYKGNILPAGEALEAAGIKPYAFKPKEALAMMNGTTVMTGIAAVMIDRAENILRSALWGTALSVHGLRGKRDHFHPVISRVKPHPGQGSVAEALYSLLETGTYQEDLECGELDALQDPYSVRCAPQILGVLRDSLGWIREWVEIEANSSNDNPLIDPDTGAVYTGGNFYGGHIAFAMDSLKAALASAADMCDRQVQLLVNPHVNRELPADLIRVNGERALYNHGFKAMSIAASALAAEALKATMPAASFSRSTESHNQDKVSMGTIAARDAERVSTLAERTAAIHLLAAAQACEIRETLEARSSLARIVERIRRYAEPLFEDRSMDRDIEAVATAIRSGELFG